MEIISKAQRVRVEEYSLSFEWRDMPGAGFSFPCDKSGNVLPLNPIALENLAKCQSGEYDVTSQGVIDCSYTYREPAQGRCSCRRIVVLSDPVTNTCACGLEYNGGGQLLAPRNYWEE